MVLKHACACDATRCGSVHCWTCDKLQTCTECVQSHTACNCAHSAPTLHGPVRILQTLSAAAAAPQLGSDAALWDVARPSRCMEAVREPLRLDSQGKARSLQQAGK